MGHAGESLPLLLQEVRMRELSLYSGAGGGLLGTKLLGWRSVGYVEINEYCQKVLRARIDDGILDKAPVFTDVREFIKSGAAREYRGFVDVVTAGFPCQPFSVAGKQQGENDERNMWPETLAVIRAVRPRYAYLENVPGLLAHEYARRIFGDLAESGFDDRWLVLSAAEVGAPHKRGRVWILADSKGEFSNVGELHRKYGQSKIPKSGNDGCTVPDSSIKRLEGQQLQSRKRTSHSWSSSSCWWLFEPNVGRVANGVASRVDRLKAIGNGQVPAVVATAWRLLNEPNT